MSLWVSSWLTKHLILFLNHTDLGHNPKWIKNKNNVIINTVTRVNCFSVYWFNDGADADSLVVQRRCFIQIEPIEKLLGRVVKLLSYSGDMWGSYFVEMLQQKWFGAFGLCVRTWHSLTSSTLCSEDTIFYFLIGTEYQFWRSKFSSQVNATIKYSVVLDSFHVGGS